MGKTHTDQSILQYFNSLCLIEERTSKSSKVAASRNLFCGVYVIGTVFFDECYLLHGVAGGHYFSRSLLLF